ncbi:uncharacterized protein LOC126203382 isoform X1 [Schistocerca nitens]|uniref:uncharacterized protein LOC126203382 isoform X1 n=1 Tax=Schistocerca nitens TaxID=7011 RepID=UPI002117462B|nr:uncharacterized protein LOC126203382 isoform X1 [Schistocerca nitens]
MSADEYEYQRMRAELLGLPPPERKPDPPAQGTAEGADEEANPGLDEQVLGVEDEQMKNITGGLDELNSILTVTQKKLNKFKVVCGSLTNLLKIRIGKEDGSSSACSTDCSRSLGSGAEAERKQDEQQDAEAEKEQSPVVNSPEKEEKSVTSQRALNIADKITSQTDRLDAMIMKAEQAEMSMSHQNKQMRSFLR